MNTKHHPLICPDATNDSFDGITIRKSEEADLPRLRVLFAIARSFMAATGNPNQWEEGYPSDELLRADIASGDSYVCMKDNEVIATFVLRGGDDPTYSSIYGGAWLANVPYATIHRIASSGKTKGVFSIVVQFALQRYSSLRIDTHANNRVMQYLILREGFQYCGVIHCRNGSQRLAYQLLR